MLITLFAGLSTAIGGGIAFIVKKDNLKALSVGLGFSAGVMIFVSFMDMLPEADKLLLANFPHNHQWLTFAGFIIGLVVAVLIDYFLPDHIDTEDVLNPDAPAHRDYKIKRAGLFTAIAICVHNFPEGMATFFTTTQNITLGLSVGIAIAIHNIPEGIAVALPMYHVTGKKRYAMLYAALSGITEPIGALAGMFIFGLFLPQVLIGALMAAVAGIMISDLVASLATLPFAVYHFNRIAVYTSLGNLLAGPVIGLVIMPFVLISLLAFPFGLEYGPLKILGWGIGQVNNITAWVSSLPYAGLPVLSMPLWGLVLIVLGGAWLCLWQLKWRLWGMLGIIIGALSVCTVKTPDVLVDVSGKAVAVKDNEGRLVVLPSRGKNFVKSIWLEKTASPLPDKAQANLLRDIWKGKKTAPEWLDISCGKKTCIYRNKIEIVKNTGLKINDRPLDTENLLGASIYLTNDKIKIDSVRGHVGYRYWN